MDVWVGGGVKRQEPLVRNEEVAYTMHTSISKSTTTFNESSEAQTSPMLTKAHPLQHRLQSYWQDHVPNNHVIQVNINNVCTVQFVRLDTSADADKTIDVPVPSNCTSDLLVSISCCKH